MANFLERMAIASRDRAEMLRASFTAEDLDQPIVPMRRTGFDLIAEIKDNSPSEGALANKDVDRASRALSYVQGGATAISVLTEPFRFAGEIGHLIEVVAAVAGHGVPVMRKDFLVDRSQILEARASGASGVLLITAIMSDADLASMLDCAFEHSLFVLLESFDEEDLERSARLLEHTRYADCAATGQLMFGVNSRDLRSLAVDSTRLERFAKHMPEGAIAVAESGLQVAEDAARVASQGYAMALVGSALMKSPDPRQQVADMLAAGRAASA